MLLDPNRPRGFAGLDEVLAGGVTWLASDQPADAILTHHGITATAGYGGLAVGLAICGWRDLPVVRVGYVDRGVRLTVEDVAALREIVRRVAPVAGEWNGAGQDGVSFALDVRLGRGLAGALGDYRRGCPTHHTVFCGMGSGLLQGETTCTWYADGNRQVTRPPGWL
jgi:hypothetical protein